MDDPHEGAEQSPVTAVVATMGWGFFGVVSAGAAMMSPMLFDAPGSERNPYLHGIVASLVAMPLLCIASVVGGWVAWAVTRRWSAERSQAGRRLRLLVATLPFVGVAGVAVGFVLLQVRCHGHFVCQ